MRPTWMPRPVGLRENAAYRIAVERDGLHGLETGDYVPRRHDSRHVEGLRSELRKLVARGILTEPEPGLFALAAQQEQSVDSRDT